MAKSQPLFKQQAALHSSASFTSVGFPRYGLWESRSRPWSSQLSHSQPRAKPAPSTNQNRFITSLNWDKDLLKTVCEGGVQPLPCSLTLCVAVNLPEKQVRSNSDHAPYLHHRHHVTLKQTAFAHTPSLSW